MNRIRNIFRVVAVLLLFVSLVSAAEITVVLTSKHPTYQAAYRGIEAVIVARKHTVKRVLLADLKNGKHKVGSGGAWISVGTEAAYMVHPLLPSDSIHTCCLTLKPEGIKGVDRHALHGVSLRIPVEGQMKLISEFLPRARGVGMLYNSKADSQKKLVADVKESLPEGLALEAVDIAGYARFKDAIKELYARDIDVVWTSSEVGIYNVGTLSAVLLTGLKKRVPVFGFALNVIKMGSLMGVYVDPMEHGRQVAGLTDDLIKTNKVPKGFSDPRFKVGLNRVVAERLRIRLSDAAYRRADYVKK